MEHNPFENTQTLAVSFSRWNDKTARWAVESLLDEGHKISYSVRLVEGNKMALVKFEGLQCKELAEGTDWHMMMTLSSKTPDYILLQFVSTEVERFLSHKLFNNARKYWLMPKLFAQGFPI